jgi:hypothetical protein
MDDPATYLAEIEMALVASPIVAEYRLVRSWANTDDGYIRVRATLSNGDFLEAAEYFIIQEGQIAVVTIGTSGWMPPKQCCAVAGTPRPITPNWTAFPIIVT